VNISTLLCISVCASVCACVCVYVCVCVCVCVCVYTHVPIPFCPFLYLYYLHLSAREFRGQKSARAPVPR